jgi:fatty acid desaturase
MWCGTPFLPSNFDAYLFLKLANHWIVMLTFLHHSDLTIPHYRAGEWNWLRGALTTVDRPFLGWIGRFFFHNVSVQYCDPL